MKKVTKTELGAVKVHKEVLENVIHTTIQKIHGVNLIKPSIWGRLASSLSNNKYPGLVIKFDRNEQAIINIRIRVYFGMNIPKIASSIQSEIKQALEKTVDVIIKDINIIIQGIERNSK